ncbi:MAG: hypothetical protein KAW16_04615 [candidate division Zixibacteria bacterium]|nr:hypothetical protein [candidate division Zixibacteria bacterium]
MKKLIFLVIAGLLFSLLVSNLAFAEMAEIKVGKGTLKVGGILQAGFTYYVEDETGFDSFTLNRARFLFWGVIVPDKVKYFVQLEHNKGVGVLDYKAQFFYVPQTEITFGRFLPNFTLYMPYSTAKLEMINYPMTTSKYAVWRQVGIQTTTTTDHVDFNLGLFNGGDIPNNTSDNNDAKDILLRADVKSSLDGIISKKILHLKLECRFGGYAWIGSAKPPTSFFDTTTHYVANPDEKTFKSNRFGGFAKVDYAKDELKLRFRGEFLAAQDEFLTGPSVDEKDTRNSQAYFAHVGVQPIKQVEFLVRYEAWDPDTDVDDNDISAITGGVNYYLEETNSMFYLNYIHKMEEGNEIDNDLIQGQVQITF